jgi:hypothetical protein
LKHVKPLLRRNTFKGVTLFLATEENHSESERKDIVAEIAAKLKEVKENEAVIQNLQYVYLKHAYPEETRELDLKPTQLQRHAYAFRPKQRVLKVLVTEL